MGSATDRSAISSTSSGWELVGAEPRTDRVTALGADWVAALALGLAVSAHEDDVAVDELLAVSGRSATVLTAASDRVRLVDTVDGPEMRRAERLLALALDHLAPDGSPRTPR